MSDFGGDAMCFGMVLNQVLAVLPNDTELAWAAAVLVAEGEKCHPDFAVLDCARDAALLSLWRMADSCSGGALVYLLLDHLEGDLLPESS